MPSHWRGLVRPSVKRWRTSWSTAEIARELGMSSETIRALAASGRIPAFRVGERGRWRVAQEDVAKVLMSVGGAVGRRAGRLLRESDKTG